MTDDHDAGRISTDGIKTTGIDAARALEEIFIDRFEEDFRPIKKVYSPLHDEIFTSGRREVAHQRRNQSRKSIDLMKKHKVFDRDLLDRIPLDETSIFQVQTRRLFGRNIPRVVVAATTASPTEDFILHQESKSPLGALDLERIVSRIAPREDIMYYAGILSTTGWEDGIEHRIPQSRNRLICLVENVSGTQWKLFFHGSLETWAGVLELFDPETEDEKIARAVTTILAEDDLQLKGGNVLLQDLREIVNVADPLFEQAIEQILDSDPDLERQEIDGTEILKRKRF